MADGQSLTWKSGESIKVTHDALRDNPDCVKVKQKLSRTLKALRALFDEQNGPPLLRYKNRWQAAFDEAAVILNELEASDG